MKKMILGACLFLSSLILLCAIHMTQRILEAMPGVTIVSQAAGNFLPWGTLLLGIILIWYGYQEK